MAAVLRNLGRTLQLAETQFLHAAGFGVKNTFIDEVSPVLSSEEAQSSLRRAVTSPLPKCQPAVCEEDDGEGDAMVAMASTSTACDEVDDEGDAMVAMASSSTACEEKDDEGDAMVAMASVSTYASTADDSDSSDMESLQSESESALSFVLRRECAFLRIEGVVLAPLDAAQSAKLPVKVAKCLRVRVRGLPGRKRNKWQNPLAYCVATALQRSGCPAFVKRSQLFAPLDASNPDSELVRVDLCTPRADDC